MSNFIETEIGLFPTHWSVSSVLNEAEVVTDYVANGSFASLKENVSYKSTVDYAILIRMVDFSRGFKGDFVYVDEKSYKFLKKSKLLGGEIIISNVGEYAGTVFRVPTLKSPMTLGPNSIMVKFKEGNDFYYYFFKSPAGQDLIQSIRTGSAIPKFNKTDFRNLKIPVLPLQEKEGISEILSSIDDKINLLHLNNKTLEELAETLFRKWFIDDVDIPKGMKLKDYVDSANTGLDAIKRAPIVEKETGIKCLRIQDVSQSKPFYKWGNSEVEENNYKRFKLIKGDIIMARTCSPGINYFVREDLVSVFNNGLVRIRANNSKVYPIFLYQLFKTRDFIGHIDGVSGGTSVQLNMQIGDLLDYDFTFINKSKQDDVVSYFLDIDEKIFYNLKQIQQLETLRDTLIPKLMSGVVRVEN